MPPVVKVVHYKRRGDLPAWIPCAECVAALVTERRAERDAILDGAHGTIDAWERETGARASPAERRFVELVREARALGVGYGFMRQVIGWEWKSTDPIGYIDDARIAEHAIAELRRALAAGATL